MKVGDTLTIGTRDLTLTGWKPRRGPNFTARAAVFDIRSGGVPQGTIEASRAPSPPGRWHTTESGIRTFGFSQLYLSMGEEEANGQISVRVTWKRW